MPKYFFYIHFLLITGLLQSFHIPAQVKSNIQFSVAASLPLNERLGKQPGLAGAFAGCIHNRLLIAGGSNFPDSMPWQGGKKTYWNDIYILDIKKNGKAGWQNTRAIRLKENIAYGASVQLGNAIVCIGGENENGISKKVFLLQLGPHHTPVITDLPELPVPLSNLSAVAVGAVVYAAGGETASGCSNLLFKMDMQKKDKSWEELPALPVELSHAVMLAGNNGHTTGIYLMGGRKKNTNGISSFYATVFEYSIEKNEWNKKHDMPHAVAAGFGMNGRSGMLFYAGGDRGETFHKVETLLSAIAAENDPIKKQQLVLQKNQLQEKHPGFIKQVLQYDIVKDEWKPVAVTGIVMPVTVPVAFAQGKYYIAGGEIKAGVRSSLVLCTNNITK